MTVASSSYRALATRREPPIHPHFHAGLSPAHPAPGASPGTAFGFPGLLLFLACLLAVPHPSRADSILREVWTGISGTSISQLTSDPRYPDNPSSTQQITGLFEAPVDSADNYGQRMHGYVIPPVTGNYTFWIASDDNGELWLSTDENPANQQRIATVASWTSSREWSKEASQQSAPVFLEANRAYYVAALQKEGGGGDNLAVRWLRPDGVDQGPIPAEHLLPWGTAFTPPQITGQPADTTAVEGQSATFTVVVSPMSPATAQWQRNGINIPGATGFTLAYGPVSLADHDARFRVLLSNNLGGTTSSEAVLSVTPDTTRPTLVSALNLGTTTLRVLFSEPVEAASAANPANYSLDSGISVTAAEFGSDTRTILLTTSPLTYGSTYSLTVNNVRDRAASPNTILPGSTLNFTAVEYAPANVGGNGSTVSVLGGFDVSGSGYTIGGSSDEFHFGYQQRTGDFDIRVRVEGVSITDPFVQAGLMARENLDPNARFAAVFASSAQLGCYFESRNTAGGQAQTSAPTGGFPANYPHTWLRLRRSGNVFTGYAGFDGAAWQQLGSVTLSLPATLFFGMAVSSQDPSASATARFRELGPATSPTSFAYSPRREPPGPSSRHTGLIISEIMYHPADRADGLDLEFVEIYNAASIFVNLTGWRLSGAIDYSFPDGFILQAGEFAVIAADPAALESSYDIANPLGPYSGRLNNAGETLRLRNAADAVRLEVEYSPDHPWPVAADGAGHSLVLARPSYGENDPRAWAASESIGGSPGELDPFLPNPWSGIVINEFLAHTDDPVLDFIELHNAGNSPVDLSGCFLSDDPLTNKFQIPGSTTLPARGFLAFDQTQLGFALNTAGETIYLISADQSRVLDVIRFGGQENGVSTGRIPDGAPTLHRLASFTPGSPNAPRRIEDVVINEIMYQPLSGKDADQFVELHNRSASSINLEGWRLADGIDYEFPAGASIPGGGYAVIGKDAARLHSAYPQLSPANTFGDFGGNLSNSGEHLLLTKPDQVVETNSFGVRVTNIIHIAVSEVTYVDGGRWSRLADGGGSSLELIDPRADTTRPSNWSASNESQKGAWQSFEVTAPLNHGNTGISADRFQILMLGTGECLIDDVEILVSGGGNLLSNGGFESGTSGWSFFGNHSTATVDTLGAFSGTRCLHLRTTGDGDTGNNAVRANLASSLSAGQTVTIRAKVRWLSGWPEVLFRVRGNWIELPVRMDVPDTLGTPGQSNSRRVSNAGPAIHDVTHTPALPRSSQPVVVSCRVSDPDGTPAPQLRYRIDPSSTLSTILMRDDGLGGDALAGDGVFSATLGGRQSGTLIAFRIEARDDAAVPATSIFPEAAPARECLIRWNDPVPFGTFAHYHMWSTAATEQFRNNSPDLNNTYSDATLVYGDFRVIYNADFRDKGSPYHGGGGDFAVAVPRDNLLLGTDERVFGSTGNGGSEATGLRGDVAGWFGEQMGIPFLHSHYMLLYRNGGQFRNVLYDLQQPDRDFAESWFGGGDVRDDLYKIAVWFEFQDNNSGFNATSATFERFLSSGSYKLARYRWNWQIRSGGDSVNDYSSLFNLIAAANNSTERVRGLLDLADMEEWMRVFAFNRVVGNWDSWTFSVGQNMYLYTPLGHRAVLLPWDIDFVLGLGDGPGAGLWGGQDPVLNQLFDLPVYRRMLWRAYQDAINGPMLAENYQPQIDARRAVLLKNNVAGITDPSSLNTYIDARRSHIQTQLQNADTATFAITSNGGSNFTTSNPTVTLAGSAPFAVATIEVNGIPYPVNWTAFHTWRIQVPLGAASNLLQITGRDLRGNLVAGATDTITIQYTGTVAQPGDWIVINEIMYHPASSDAEFLELHNRHPSVTFDLSGFNLNGLGYTFPTGTLLQPGAYLLLAENRAAFANAYGATLPVHDEYSGSLDNSGERLSLIQPGATSAEDVLIDDVRYDPVAPWPATADGFGPSLQLIDAAQDNWRAGNWAVTSVGDLNQSTPGRANDTRDFLQPYPLLWINEVLPNNLSGALDNAGEREPWIELFNAASTNLDLSAFHLTDDPLNFTQWQFPAGTTLGAGQFLLVWADGEPSETTAGDPHTSFRLNPTNGFVALTRTQAGGPAVMDYLRYTVTSPDRAFGSYPDGDPRQRRLLHLPTPGADNNPSIPSVPVFINEWMASNGSTIADPADGDYDDWFELHNAGPNPVDLSGYFLTSDLAVTNEFRIPDGVIIPAGGFLLVWADDEDGQNAPGQPIHANFRLSAAGEQIGFYTPDGTLVDGVTFEAQSADISHGRFPDSGDAPFLFFSVPTPAAANVAEFANQPPILDAIADRSVNEGQSLSLTATASDPDQPAQTLTFSLIDPPAGAVINAGTGAFSWTPSESQGPDILSITMQVADDGTPIRAATRSFTVTVNEVNLPPSLDPIPNAMIDEGSPFTFVAGAIDPDLPPQMLLFSLEPGAPAGATINASTGEFTWTPSESQGPGDHTITVRVTDNGQPALSGTQSFSLTVLEVNNPPLITQVQPQSIDEETTLTLNIEAIDTDTPPASFTYSIEDGPAGAVVDPDSGLLTWTPVEADGPRDYNFTVRVSETGGSPSSTMSFLVGVREVNTAPTLDPIPDFNAGPGDLITFTSQASDADLPAQALAFNSLFPLPGDATLDPVTGVFTWQLSDDPPIGTHVMTLRVSDDGPPPLSAERSFQITVRAPAFVTINEIMHRPSVANAGFIELANHSTVNTFDLDGWRLEGYDFVFPAETLLGPGEFLCVANDLTAFRAAYGDQPAAVGNATVNVPADGGILRLLRPGSTAGTEELVDEVRFALTSPWPSAAATDGASLQLIDPSVDHRLVANWAASIGSVTNAPVNVLTMTAPWKFWQSSADPGATWNSPGHDDTGWSSGNALLYVEEAALPAPKNTPLILGQTTYYFRSSFNFSGNPTDARLHLSTIVDDGAIIYLNGNELLRLGMPAGTVGQATFASRVVGDAAIEGPFDVPATGLRQGENIIAVEVHQTSTGSSDIVFGVSADLVTVSAASYTPGSPNSVAASLPAFAPAWINEVLPDNATGMADNAGDQDPWIELVNPGDMPVLLDGWSLTDNYSVLDRWLFPAGTSIPAGGFLLVWADAEPAESIPGGIHASFRLDPNSGSVALARLQNGVRVVVDHLDYNNPGTDDSLASLTDGDPLRRGISATPTPGAPNAITPPETPILSIELTPAGDVSLSWYEVAGRSYWLESTEQIEGGTWEELSETTGNDSTRTHVEPLPTGASARFYRVLSQ